MLKLYPQPIVWIFCFILLNNTGRAQTTIYRNPDNSGLQYGFSFSAVLELSLNNYKPKPVFHISGNLGIGSTYITDWIYPALNLEFDLYNGGMGSRNENSFLKSCWDLDIIAALTITSGINNRFKNPGSLVNSNIPLYYFADFVYPSLSNPFDYSFSLGTNIILTPINTEKKNQRVGFLNIHLNAVQLSYYNDGGVPMANTYLGDRRDRYYTGGAVLSFHGKQSLPINFIEISYQKFTGYTKNAFELSNDLYLNFMNYHTPEQRKYNKSLWSINIGSSKNGWNTKLSYYNKISWDMQHFIHWGLFNTYHMVPYKPFWAISGGYIGAINKIGAK